MVAAGIGGGPAPVHGCIRRRWDSRRRYSAERWAMTFPTEGFL
jgi:hypothetical protein